MIIDYLKERYECVELGDMISFMNVKVSDLKEVGIDISDGIISEFCGVTILKKRKMVVYPIIEKLITYQHTNLEEKYDVPYTSNEILLIPKRNIFI